MPVTNPVRESIPHAKRERRNKMRPEPTSESGPLRGLRAASVMFSHYPGDPRPRRAAEALAAEGMIVDVICLKQKADEPSRETFNGVNVTRVPFRRQRGGKFSYLFQYASFLLLAFFIMGYRTLFRRYRIVHVHNMPDFLVFSALIPRLFGAKVILDIHDPMPELMMTIYGLGAESRAVRILKRVEKWSLRFADVVLTVNLACRKILSARSCPADKVHVVMNSPDEGIFKFRPLGLAGFPRRQPGKPFVIMYHGSIVERHGLDIAVKALAKVRENIPEAELWVYGQKTKFLDQVMDSLNTGDLRRSVKYLGPRNLEQIVEAIDACDVGIIPNRRSIFTELNTPTRIFEYLSRAKPVIAPLAPGITDYFELSQLVYFELGNAADLARCMELVFTQRPLVERITRRGQDVYLDHRWSRDRMKFVNVAANLVSRERGNRTRVPVRDSVAA
jgi:glycosyltransferase involved in cell wall biosynthesis